MAQPGGAPSKAPRLAGGGRTVSSAGRRGAVAQCGRHSRAFVLMVRPSGDSPPDGGPHGGGVLSGSKMRRSSASSWARGNQ